MGNDQWNGKMKNGNKTWTLSLSVNSLPITILFLVLIFIFPLPVLSTYSRFPVLVTSAINFQVVITFAPHVSLTYRAIFVLTSTKRSLDLLSFVIGSHVFEHLSRDSYIYKQCTPLEQSVLTFDRCRPNSLTFGYY